VDVELAGVNYVTSQPVARGSARATTGGFKPFGRRSDPDETVRGSQRCGGAIYRLAPDQDEPDRLAWGLRNPAGVVCSADGKIWVTEGGMEERGSRPIAGAPDSLWEVHPGGYYGWPDHAAGISVTDARFRLPGHPQPRRLLGRAPKVTGLPAASFPARSGVGRLDFANSEAFGCVGDAFVALSGSWSLPAYVGEDGVVPGHRVVRVDPRTGETRDFLVNRSVGPSSATNGGGLERPFDVRFDPTGEVLYIVDLGEVQVTRDAGVEPYGGTGVLWRVTQVRTMHPVPARGRKAQQAPPEDEAGPDDEAAADESPADDTGAEEGTPELAASEEIAAAGEGLNLEPPDSAWLQEDTPPLAVVEAEAPPPAAPETMDEASEAAAAEAPLPEPEAAAEQPSGEPAPDEPAAEESAPAEPAQDDDETA
jgi:hypothetical protein